MKPSFLQNRPLSALTQAEWESLCDGCGRCCLHKLEDEETGDLHYTGVACRLLDLESCRCRDYQRRSQVIPQCIVLGPNNMEALAWMPESCAYRRLAEGKPLASWHHLISGDPDTVHEAGVSIRSFAVSEEQVCPEQLEDFILDHM